MPLNAHHKSLHIGMAGDALLEKAGNLVSPTAPITPWADCAGFAEVFGSPSA